MNISLRVVAGVLAAVFLLAGAMKLSCTPRQPATSGLGWAEDFGTAPRRSPQ
ncbi:hypothetical protein OHU25_05790 [Streptomyces sp. NBC_00117]|uniref:hypothetical protein n=1 Tax=unclassified Streptomyces TaxID=2593676 RepID=UPI002E27116F|nr:MULTISPECIES: hypothetical protein [unclassified Streptomyces]